MVAHTQNKTTNKPANEIWVVGLHFAPNYIYIRTKNVKRTLAKLYKRYKDRPEDEVPLIGVHPPASYYWFYLNVKDIPKLLKGEEVKVTYTLHFPPMPGEAWGTCLFSI